LSDHYTSARFWRCALQVNPKRYSRTPKLAPSNVASGSSVSAIPRTGLRHRTWAVQSFWISCSSGTVEAELPDLTFLSDTALDGLPHAEILRRGRALLEGIRTGAGNAVEQLRGLLDRAKDDIAALTRELEQGLDAAERGLEAEFAKLRLRHGRADQDHPAAASAQRPAPGVRSNG
jgi:hypothetical protein